MATGRQPARDFGPAFSANADPSPLPRRCDPADQYIADLEAALDRLLDLWEHPSDGAATEAAYEHAKRIRSGGDV